LKLLRAQHGRGEQQRGEELHGSIVASKDYNKSVAVPSIPGPFDQIGRRAFSFYPAIIGIEHNEWLLRRVTWTEIEVINTKSSQELLIPRQFVGEISAIEEPFLIAGLIKELEYKSGMVLPHRRRVIEMPRAVNGSLAIPASPFVSRAEPAVVVGIRLDEPKSNRTKRVLRWLAAGILACVTLAQGLIMFGGHRKSVKDTKPIPRLHTF
jgi:hypothetical protein